MPLLDNVVPPIVRLSLMYRSFARLIEPLKFILVLKVLNQFISKVPLSVMLFSRVTLIVEPVKVRASKFSVIRL